MDHPYKHLPSQAFWRSGVANVSPLEIPNIYKPRFSITRDMKIASAGSCFAQHIGHHFKGRNYAFLDKEKPPPLLSRDRYSELGFGIYSARYGNIYSARQLLQLFERSMGMFKPDEPFWEKEGQFYDPFRPTIQKSGFATHQEAVRDRHFHLTCVQSLLSQTDLFVFTFGLTEAWLCSSDQAVLPSCPGTIAGEFDSNKYEFHNFSFPEVLEDIESFIGMAHQHNKNMKFLFTVSPVPLIATATKHHVLPATIYSKSVLRAVCGSLYEKYDFVDYFPSYELISAHPTRAMFFQPNLRSVSRAGVEHVMNIFFSAHGDSTQIEESQEKQTIDDDDIICDEVILEDFQP